MNPFIVLGYTVPIKYDCVALTCPSPSPWHLMKFQMRTSIVMVSSRGKMKQALSVPCFILLCTVLVYSLQHDLVLPRVCLSRQLL